MRFQLLVMATVATHVAATPAKEMTVAKSYTGWDCCKPICANGNGDKQILANRGVAKVCDKNNKIQDQDTGLFATTGCSNGGTAFLCDMYQPQPVADDLSYGFAIKVSASQAQDNPDCCKCFDVQWLSGNAAGKRMVVQVLTPGGAGGDVKRDDLIIMIPGGGLGPLNSGCPRQYGNSFNWGRDQGGVANRTACEKLPTNLQGGCYWRFNWAKGELNGWDISYTPTTCPDRLTSISGCQA